MYYFPSHFLLIITSFTDVLYASLFVIVYSYAYTIQSLNTALLSCLLRTLGIVIHLYTQYTKLLTSDSSCLISWYSCMQPCSSVLQRYINVPRNRPIGFRRGKGQHSFTSLRPYVSRNLSCNENGARYSHGGSQKPDKLC